MYKTDLPLTSSAHIVSTKDVSQYLHQYHSSELKTRMFYVCLSLILSFILCFIQSEYLLYKLTSLLLKIIPNINSSTTEETSSPVAESLSGFIFTELLEGFWSTLLVSGYCAFLLSLPIIYYHGYKFLLPGLTYIEARVVKTFILLSLSFIIIAHLLTYFLIIPYAASFFLSFQSNYPQAGFLSFTGRIYPALTFILNCFSIISFLFQLPLAFFFTYLYLNFNQGGANSTSVLHTTSESGTGAESPTGIANLGWLKSSTFLRKLLFFSLVLLTAIFSPPDIYSQLFLFIPLFLILESLILMIFIFKESPYYSRKILSKN